MSQLPLTPYAGTSGWSGSSTSEDRALREDAGIETSRRQQTTLDYLLVKWNAGVTWKELADKFGWHHGQASGALSILHKEGKIARLTETRNRCKVYVLPDAIYFRQVEQHGSNKPRLDFTEVEKAEIAIALKHKAWDIGKDTPRGQLLRELACRFDPQHHCWPPEDDHPAHTVVGGRN